MTEKTSVSGIILAGGAGRRVQGEDKGLLDWHGKPLVQHVAERFEPQVDELLISSNRNHAQYAKVCPLLVKDSRDNYPGPLAGIEAAGSKASGDIIVIVACDTPLIPQDLVLRLLEAFDTANGDGSNVSYASDGEREQYLFAAIRRNCLPSLSAYLDSGQRSVHRWYATQRPIIVDFSDHAEAFANYNYLRDLTAGK